VRLNLNADLGESFGAWTMGDDENLLEWVDSANVACGFHAGDPLVMTKTLSLAKHHSVSVGAHPGFADLQGFGRRAMRLPPEETRALIVYQLSALDGMARTSGYQLTHVKPHGALNNMACDDRTLADVIVAAVRDFNSSLIFLAPVLSQLEAAAKAINLPTAGEIFADRAYTETGSLVPRNQAGAVMETSEQCIEHVRKMIDAAGLVTQQGNTLKTAFHSICVHGDNAHAVQTAKDIRQALIADGHELCSLPELKIQL